MSERNLYQISNDGNVIPGFYGAESKSQALEVMAQDSGYKSFEDLIDQSGDNADCFYVECLGEEPDMDVVKNAAAASFSEDREMIVGYDAYFGWVYRDADDLGAIDKLTSKYKVDSCGFILR